MANFTDISREQFGTCRNCGARIAWLTSSRTGRSYMVNASLQSMRVRNNDFHSCREQRQQRITTPAQLAKTQEQLVTEARQQYTSAFDSMLATHLGLWLRNNGTEKLPEFVEEFTRMVTSNLDQRMNAMLRNAAETAAAKPVPVPTPAAVSATLDSIVDATERFTYVPVAEVDEMESNANGYNPAADNVGYSEDNDWPSDEDVPF